MLKNTISSSYLLKGLIKAKHRHVYHLEIEKNCINHGDLAPIFKVT